MLEPVGITVNDENATVTLTKNLPEMRSARAMARDTSSSFVNMRPEESKLDLMQPFTLTLTFDPIVLLPMVKPLIVIENGIDAVIPPPEMLKTTKFEKRGLLDTGSDELAEPAATTGAPNA